MKYGMYLLYKCLLFFDIPLHMVILWHSYLSYLCYKSPMLKVFMSQCVPGVAISPLVEGMNRTLVLFRVMTSTQIPRCSADFPTQNMGVSYGDVAMTLEIWNDGIYISLEGYKGTNARWGGCSKLDFRENRSIPLQYLGVSKHWTCQEFIQMEKSCV